MLRVIQMALASANFVSPKWSADLTMYFCSIPQKYPRPHREVELMQSAKLDYYIGADGSQNPYWTWGEGPTVILCHGWSGRGSQMATLAKCIAEAGFKAVVFDCTAHGEASGKYSGFGVMAQDILGLTKKFANIHAVVGHSMGGMMAVFCRRLGLMVDRFVLLGSPCAPTPIVRKMESLLKVSATTRRLCEERIANEFGQSWQALLEGNIYISGTAPLLLVYDEQDEELMDTDHHLNIITSNYANASILRTKGLGHRKILWDQTVLNKVTAFLLQQ